MGQNLNNLLKRKILRRQHVQRTNLKSGVPKKKKKNTPNFPEIYHFVLPSVTCAYQGVNYVCFSEDLVCFAFV